MISYALPPFYRAWMDQALGAPILAEPRATCSNCVMCSSSERAAANDYQFNPNTKCCAYHPSLANYLVGAILSDNDPAFSASKEQFIRGAHLARVSPIGINPPYFTQLFYRLKPFGKHESILCPFYQQQRGGLCGIWQYRNSRCSTWFCKHERGRTGLLFWNALDEMMAFAEQKLAEYCVEKIQVTIPEHPVDAREAIWGNWAHHEIEFFVACWENVRPMTWDDVLGIGGEDLQALVNKTKTAANKLNSPQITEVLLKSEFLSEDLGDGNVRIWAYSKFNPLDLPSRIVEVLDRFDGRSVKMVLSEIETNHGFIIEPEVLVQLMDYEVLTPPRPPQT